MADISLIRHQMIFDPAKHNPQIHIIGAGATGSRLWLALVELGLTNIHIYDFDEVEAHNLANQVYMANHVGMAKVSALKEYYSMKTDRPAPDSMTFNQERIEPGGNPERFPGILFLLTDTMASRKEIFDSYVDPIAGNMTTSLMIETRMASSYGDVKVINPFDPVQVKQWRGSLISDNDAEVSACGSSISVGPTASIIANFAVWQMIHALTNEKALDPSINLHLKPMMLSTEEAA